MPTEDHRFTAKPLPKTKASSSQKKQVPERSSRTQQSQSRDERTQQLQSIYKDEDGNVPDMKHFTHGASRTWRRVVAGATVFLLLACGAAWGGFFVFSSLQSDFAEQSVAIDIQAPQTITAGDSITYRIRIRNGQRLELSKTELTVAYPEGFTVTNTTLLPVDTEKSKWRFGVIEGGKNVELEVTGVLVGSTGSQQSLRAFFTYRPSNFNSEFQTIGSSTQTINQSPITLVTEFPKTASPGSAIALPVTLRVSTATTGTVRVVIDGGSHFTFSEPKKGETIPAGVQRIDARTWLLSSLTPEKPITLTANGSFTGDALETEKIVTTASLMDSGREYVVATHEHELPIARSSLVLSLIANGSSSDVLIAPEGNLTFSLFSKNTSDKPIKNLTIRAVMDTPSFQNKSILAINSLNAGSEPKIAGEQVNPDTRRVTLSWSSKERAALANLEPQKEDTIPFSLSLLSRANLDYTKLTQFTITAIAEGSYDNGTRVSLQTQPITITIGSDTAIDADAVPVNPETLEPTSKSNTYRVTWTVKNDTHAVKDVVVKASLVGEVEWLGQELQNGSLTFDAKSKSARWTIPSISSGNKIERASFVIRLNTQTAGQQLLMTTTALEATDTVINRSLQRSSAAIELGD